MSDIEFEEGDTVLVRVRENRTSGSLRAKFIAEVDRMGEYGGYTGSPRIRLDLEFGTMNSVTLRPYEAEFEVVDDVEEVRF